MSYLSPAMAVSLMPSPKDVYCEDGNRFSNTMKIILYLICQTDQLAKFVLILFFRSHKRSPHFQKQSLFPFLFLFGWGVVTYVFHGILRLRTVYHNSAYAILERTVFMYSSATQPHYRHVHWHLNIERHRRDFIYFHVSVINIVSRT